MKKYLAPFISLLLIILPLNAQDFKKSPILQKIYEKYPNAEIKVVSLDAYENIKTVN